MVVKKIMLNESSGIDSETLLCLKAMRFPKGIGRTHNSNLDRY
jgi:hypothetical protein